MINKGGKTILILGLCGASFFIFGLFSGLASCEKAASAANVGVVINEIMIGQTGAAKNEFIELYNNSETEVDLTGFSLKKRTKTGTESNLVSSNKFLGLISSKGYFLVAQPDFKDVVGADLAYSGSSYSIANNNSIVLYDNENEIVDMVGYGEATDFEESAALNPENNQSISRQPEGRDSDNNGLDFIILESPTPQGAGYLNTICGDGEIDGAEECDDGNNLIGDGCDSKCQIEDPEPELPVNQDEIVEQGETAIPEAPDSLPGISETKIYKLGSVVINEFVSDPGDGDEEWIELYNTTKEAIDLDGWTIEEGSGAVTKLAGNLGAAGSDKYFVLAKPKGSLNNKGDIIILKYNDVLVDQIAYGDWDDGNLENNAGSASDPNSVARKMDGYNTYNNVNDFVSTAKLTKGSSNIIEDVDGKEDEEISFEDKERYDYNTNLIISEILPNPEGSDNQEEFIELYNIGDKEIRLLGWQLGDETKNKYIISNEDFVVKAGEYKAIYRGESKIALNNGGDTVKLYQPLKDKPLQIVEFGRAEEGWSYNVNNLERGIAFFEWGWSEMITPDKENNVQVVNHVPAVEFYCPEIIEVGQPIIFDSSDTMDEDDDELSYDWDFGDGFKNNLSSPGHTYLKAGVYTVKLAVTDGENEVMKEKIIQVVEDISYLDNLDLASTTVLGWDDFYQEDIVINEIMPSPEGSDTENEWIELYNRGEVKINLLNWRLDDEDGGSKPYDIISDLWLEPDSYHIFNRLETGLALNNTDDSVYLYDNNNIIIHNVNYISAVEGESYARGENDKWFWTSLPTPNEKNLIVVSGGSYIDEGLNSGSGQKEKIIYDINLENIDQFKVGDLIKTKGTVAVLPGIIGSQYFYIASSSGLQIYSYKKDFPKIKLGDYIEVSGELSETNGEWRLKTKQASDILIIENKELPVAEKINCERINEDLIGSLINVSGTITEKKSSSLFLDDGTDEALIYVKKTTGISLASLKEGDDFEITGIVGKTSSGIRLMPRGPDDILKKSNLSDEGQVLGEVSVNDEWEIGQRDKKQEMLNYLLIIALGIIILLFGLLVKEKYS